MHDPCQCFRIKVTSCKQGRVLGTLLKKQKEKTSNASVRSKDACCHCESLCLCDVSGSERWNCHCGRDGWAVSIGKLRR